MTTIKLDGSNYMNWKVAVEVYLIAKRKVYTIRRDPPVASDPTSEQWETDDACIRSLLWQSMIPHILGTMMQLPTAKMIWDHTAVMFSGVGNLSLICATYSEWRYLRRGDTPLSTYYGQFVSHCQQLDVFMPLTIDLAEAARQRDQLRVVQFLETLGPEFVFSPADLWFWYYAFPRQCLGATSFTPVVFYGPATAAYAAGDRSTRGGGTFGRGRGRSCPYCTHCRHEGHREETCYVLHPERRPRSIAHPRRPRSTSHPHRPRSTAHPPPPAPLQPEIPPSTSQSFLAALDHPGWRAAMDLEMQALQANQTWGLVHLLPGARPVGCRWVYAVKHLPDSTIERLKARLVAK
ncbi:uncharacterized protein LOC143858627 [Tasmannia lanceolata]|uniref:uncharacterized protein LOC143858627 n=1 Tax=Tasmannia lanceolata TaxID=3420 RepID=UPI0040639BC2